MIYNSKTWIGILDSVAGMSQEKLFDEMSKLEISKYYEIFYFDFFFNVQNWDSPEGRDSCLKINKYYVIFRDF